MTTKKGKSKVDYSVREPNIDDAIEFYRIIASGLDAGVGQAVGLAILGARNENNEMAVQAAAQAVAEALGTAFNNRATSTDARNFIFSLWEPKLALSEGETYEAKKREEWKKLPMRGANELIDAFRKTDNFADFLEFFTDMMPNETDSGETSTPSGGTPVS
jgi:hypothetical protein